AFAFSSAIPCVTVTASRNSRPACFGSSYCSALSEIPRLTHFSCSTSSTALTRSSLFATSEIESPECVAAAPVSRKSKRFLISLAVWLTGLSISWVSTLLTMSKDGSATARNLLSELDQRGSSRCPAGQSHLARTSPRQPPCRDRYARPRHGRLPERPKGAVCK